MNQASPVTNFFSELMVRKGAFISVLMICILYPYLNGYSLEESFFYLAKWMAVFFAIYYACLVFVSYFKHMPKFENGKIHYFRLKALPLVYIFFAVTYILIGAFNIDTISQVSWSISEDMKTGIKAEPSDTIWEIYNIYQTYLPIMLGYIVLALTINCARSYYQIHELDTGELMGNSNTYDSKIITGAKVDWVLRLVIAVAFILFEKQISNIAILGQDSSKIYDQLTNFSYGGMVLYSLIIFWVLITQFYYSNRSHRITQYIIGFGGIIFSVTLFLMVSEFSNGDMSKEMSMFYQLILYSLMTISLLLSGGAIVFDFLSPKRIT